MTCKATRRLLAAFESRDLSTGRSAAVRTHLAACADCRKHARAIEAAWQAIALIPGGEASAEFRARFWERIRRAEGEPASLWERFHRPAWIPAVAGGMAACMLGVALGMRMTAGSPRLGGTTREVIRLFASPQPANSIEAIYLHGPEASARDGRDS